VPGFTYPNEAEIQWSLLIVLYPFITGLVAGSFVVSALYHVFGLQQLKPVARLSLLTALAFLLVAPLPLLGHLGRPERSIEIFLTPHFTSAMAGFGYIWMFYLAVVMVETWLVFRPHIVAYARRGRGLHRLVHSILTLGVNEITEEEEQTNQGLIRALALVGIPSAAVLHGYVGFIFGGIKANPWWSSPLMPVIFLLSAVVSGIALLILLYVAVMKMANRPIDHECLRALSGWLLGFLVVDLTIEGLELLQMAYESEESWDVIYKLITQHIAFSYLVVQIGLGSLLPLTALLMIHALRPDRATHTGATLLSAALILTGVFAMRWNVVIGGQLISKSLRGFLSYTPEIWGREGVVAAAAVLLLPLLILAAALYLVPPWRQPEEIGEPQPWEGETSGAYGAWH
jgi:Ni/Fe-hydrogenase subunit HybB-like protein